MAKNKFVADDLTLAGMPLEEEEQPRRRRKSTAEKPRVDPWYLVALECPCKASAESHHLATNGIVRVHIIAIGQPVMCVPGAIRDNRRFPTEETGLVKFGHSEQWDTDLLAQWHKSPAYNVAELSG